MKLTLNKIIWIADRVVHYCNLLKVEVPYVFTTMQEYNEWKRTVRTIKGERVGRSNCLGVCHRREKFIVILPKRSSNLINLDEVIRHELIHYAKPSYNHCSRQFYERMRALKSGHINENGRFI